LALELVNNFTMETKSRISHKIKSVPQHSSTIETRSNKNR